MLDTSKLNHLEGAAGLLSPLNGHACLSRHRCLYWLTLPRYTSYLQFNSTRSSGAAAAAVLRARLPAVSATAAAAAVHQYSICSRFSLSARMCGYVSRLLLSFQRLGVHSQRHAVQPVVNVHGGARHLGHPWAAPSPPPQLATGGMPSCSDRSEAGCFRKRHASPAFRCVTGVGRVRSAPHTCVPHRCNCPAILPRTRRWQQVPAALHGRCFKYTSFKPESEL